MSNCLLFKVLCDCAGLSFLYTGGLIQLVSLIQNRGDLRKKSSLRDKEETRILYPRLDQEGEAQFSAGPGGGKFSAL